MMRKRTTHHDLKPANAADLLGIFEADLHLEVKAFPPVQVKEAQGFGDLVEGVLCLELAASADLAALAAVVVERAVALAALEDVGADKKPSADAELEVLVSLLGDVLFTVIQRQQVLQRLGNGHGTVPFLLPFLFLWRTSSRRRAVPLNLLILHHILFLKRPPHFDILRLVLTTARDSQFILIVVTTLRLEVALSSGVDCLLRLRHDTVHMIDAIRSVVHVMQPSLLQLIIKRHVEPALVGASQRSGLLEALLEHLKGPDGV